MFKKIIILAVTAVFLAAAVWLILGFTKEQKAPRVGNFLCIEASVAPAKPYFPPLPHGKPLLRP